VQRAHRLDPIAAGPRTIVLSGNAIACRGFVAVAPGLKDHPHDATLARTQNTGVNCDGGSTIIRVNIEPQTDPSTLPTTLKKNDCPT